MKLLQFMIIISDTEILQAASGVHVTSY